MNPTQQQHDPYAGISNASGSKGGIYFDPGNFRVRVLRVTDKKSEKDKTRLFIVETEILKIYNIDPTSKLKVGDHPSNVLKENPKWPDLFMGNVADYMRAALSSLSFANGVAKEPDEIELNSAVAHEVSGEDNITVGVELDVYAYRRKKDSDYTSIDWTVPADIKAKAAKSVA